MAYGYGQGQIEKAGQDRAQKVVDILKLGDSDKIVEALKGDRELAPAAAGFALEEMDSSRKAKQAGDIKRQEIQAQLQAFGAGGSPEQPTNSMFGEYTPTKDQRNQLIREGLSMGLTPNAASEYANENLSASKSLSKDALAKIEEARRRAANLESIAAEAEAGVEGAGATGGMLGGVRNLASLAWSILSPEEREQRASEKLLDATKPKVIMESRTPGSGALSDFESRALLGAGASSLNTPEENNILIGNMRNTAQIQRDYSNFLEAYIQDKGDALGADIAWQQYKAANPPFIRGEDGKLTFNKDRQSWVDYFAGNAVPQVDSATTSVGSGSSTPLPGETKEQFIARMMAGG
ncbi:MAG: hypothetical protein E6Q97_00820 [Desulfurellales bacterium]|nr:MAG: hypothetical protein E6Q97_00820 [Desulfurellales bacterium]